MGGERGETDGVGDYWVGMLVVCLFGRGCGGRGGFECFETQRHLNSSEAINYGKRKFHRVTY